MMKDEYKKEIDSICASEDFKDNMKHNILNASKPKRKISFQYKFASLLVISCLVIVALTNQKSEVTEETPKEPPTTYPDDNDATEEIPSDNNHVGGDGFGFSGVMLKDASELKHNSAYDLSNPSQTMPIYRSQYKKNKIGIIVNQLTNEEKENILKKYAKLLKFSDYTISQRYDTYDCLIDKKGTITFEEGSIFIEFSKQYIKDSSIDMNVDNHKEANQIVNQLYTKYKDVFGINNPLIDTYYNYDIYGEKCWTFQLSEKADKQNKSLINQNANLVNFINNDQGLFSSFRIYLDNVSVVKEEPIISLETAKRKFNNHQYLTTISPFEPKDIGYIEMTYLLSSNGLYLPYYLFYALSDEKNDNNCKTYVLCYVSAIPDNLKEKYNVPKEIQFN